MDIGDLPDEVLEYIFSLVPPYRDLDACKLVCKHWRHLVQNVISRTKYALIKSVEDNDVYWSKLTKDVLQDPGTVISKRYSHAACYHDGYMYVFGGCTATNTTFNDFWKLDLSTRKWIRPLPTGTYPSPKACASVVVYQNQLILFGGWTQPSSSPLQQSVHLFNQLHVYCTVTNRWNVHECHPTPPHLAGHSATVHRHLMVVFGGIRSSHRPPSNDVWCYDIEKDTWLLQSTSPEPKPCGRYGQSQIFIDEEHLLILGGCGGPNKVLNDAWLLEMHGAVWQWIPLTIDDPDHAPTRIWCSPACLVYNRVVVLAKAKNQQNVNHLNYNSPINMSAVIRGRGLWVPPVEIPKLNASDPEPVPADEPHVNGRKGVLRRRPAPSSSSSDSEPENHRSGGGGASLPLAPPTYPRPSIRPNASENRQRRLECLKRMEERIQSLGRHNARHQQALKSHPIPAQVLTPPLTPPVNAMVLYVLDIKSVLSEKRVRWLSSLEAAPVPSAPEEAVLYSLIHGRGELVVFGGVQKFSPAVERPRQELPNNAGCPPNIVSNAVYFITPPKAVI